MNMRGTKITKADIDSYRVMLGDKLYYEEVTRVYNINKMVDNMKKDFIEQRIETIKEEVIRKNKKGE